MSQDARLDEEQITKRRAYQLGMAYVNTSAIELKLFPEIMTSQQMMSTRVVPLAADRSNINFGITTNTSQLTINELKQRFSDQRLVFSIISETGFNKYMQLYNPPKKVVYEDINFGDNPKAESMVDAVSRTLREVRADDMLAYIVQQAYRLKASDIHLENERDQVRIRFRVDGVLHPVAFMDRDKYRQLSSALAIVANVSTNATDAQTGHISRQFMMATGEQVQVNLRVETVPAMYGMDVVMRLFNFNLDFFKLENLGLGPQEAMAVNDVIKHPTGMVLIVGPTGSGKTTTLYSLINTLNTDERKIITLEDPIEYVIPGITQIPVTGEIQGQDFAEKLRAVLRLDPDVVMVGEIRDQDTAKTAIQASLTGHLVMSTFHASTAAAALTRMLDFIGDNPLFASAMHLVMAQRLVRKLDPKTKIEYKPDDNLRRQLKNVIDTFPHTVERPDVNKIRLYKAGSSEENPFGYSGQVALREQLMMTPGVRQILRMPPNQITTEGLQAQAVEEGMKTMLHDGLLKVFAGETSLEEVFRVVG